MIKQYFLYIISILFLPLSFCANAQSRGLMLSDYYSPKDYQGGTQNWAAVQDQRGVMYFGNSSGVLEFDGKWWRLIQVLNKSSVRSLAFDSNNTLYAGAFNELGFLAPDKSGSLQYNSLTHLIDSTHLDFGDVWDTYCYSDSVYFLTDRFLFRYFNGEFNYWNSSKSRFYLSFKIDNDLLVQEIGKGLLQLENDSLKLISGGEFFADKKIHSIFKLNNSLLICTRDNGLYLYDNSGSVKSFSDLSAKADKLNSYFLKNNFYQGISITENRFAFSSVCKDVLIVDSRNWSVVDVITKETLGVNSSVFYSFLDCNNLLWLGLANGISKVEITSPFRYWNDETGINGSISDVAQIGDYHYVSTGEGVFYNNLQIDNFELNNYKKVSGKFEQAWGFIYFHPVNKSSEKIISDRDADTILLVSTGEGVFKIVGNKSTIVSNRKGVFKSYQYKKDPSKLLLGLNNGLASVSYKNGKWIDNGMLFGLRDNIRTISEDSLGNIWLSSSYKGVIRVKNPFSSVKDCVKIEFFDTTNGLPSVNQTKLHDYKNGVVFESNMDFYSFVDKTNRFELFNFPADTSAELADVYVDSLSAYRIYGNVISDSYVTSDKDKNEWFATVEGTFVYSENREKNNLYMPKVVIRNVSAKDTVLYNGASNCDNLTNSNIVLDYSINSLVFSYSLPYYEQESKNEYSFYLEGFDKGWSEWTTENKKEYTNLNEGKYIFKVRAKNIYQIVSDISEYKFTLLPPWYRTIWAYFTYVFLSIILIAVVVKLYTLKLIKEKDNLEAIVAERTCEILMQKEELLVQAEHLKEAYRGLEKQKTEITKQTVELKKANIELIKLSKVASETDNAIGIFDKNGELEWVNAGFTRMYGYTLEQYKSEVNSNIINSTNYPNINESVIKCLNEKTSVSYKFNTITRDGRDVWVQTTLTNIVDANGETINLIAIDSDITELKNFEREIEEQRDNLAISNATKNKFFRIIAHDLRNPISTLAGSTNVIYNDFDDYKSEQTKLFIGELNKLSNTTFNLLENLLDWSSTQTGDIYFAPVKINLLSVCKENIELINTKVDQKSITLNLEIPENYEIFADENMVNSIIRNLLSNAVKFTPDNGEISISSKSNGEFINFTVKDSGIGISEQDLKKIFKIDQLHTTSGLSNERGSGLGLILCKEFVEINGGKIEINSIQNQGTLVELSLKKAE